jgi:tetratricopeptide (TPR) repeat protein
MDYYGLMVFNQILRAVLLASAVSGFGPFAYAQKAASAPSSASQGLDAELFYDVLLGEMITRTGDPLTGYTLMLEAARRSNSEQLYQRAVDIALQSRSGEYALTAAQAWKAAHPQSREANRYVWQILLALNRPGETALLLRQELAQSTQEEQLSTLQRVPQMYGRASDAALAARVAEEGLQDVVSNTQLGAAAWVAIGRLRLNAQDQAGTLMAIEAALGLEPRNEDAVRLAIGLVSAGQPNAELIVEKHLEGKASAGVRMTYARALLEAKRYAEADTQLAAVTESEPGLAEAWLVLAQLQLQANRLAQAEISVQRFMDTSIKRKDDDEQENTLRQAYLLLSKIAAQRGQYDAAQSWLDRIEGGENLFAVQNQRAQLLAGQGKLSQARALLRRIPESSADDARLKLMAEVELLRNQKQYESAFEMQQKLVELDPKNSEALYTLAMLAEQNGALGTMERLLRQLIARDPEFAHAYNALGYSFADRGIRLKEAKQLINKALELLPGDPSVTDSLGWVEFRLGNKTESLRLLQKAYAKNKEGEIAAHLGEVLWSLNDKDAARAIWREALQAEPDHAVLRKTLQRLGVDL